MRVGVIRSQMGSSPRLYVVSPLRKIQFTIEIDHNGLIDRILDQEPTSNFKRAGSVDGPDQSADQVSAARRGG